jgi:hypothetical protein
MLVLSGKVGLEGPVGGDTIASCPADPGRSFRAFGPVGGALPELEVGDGSVVVVLRFGTEPNAGAEGATGGGETSFVAVRGSVGIVDRCSSFGLMRSGLSDG